MWFLLLRSTVCCMLLLWLFSQLSMLSLCWCLFYLRRGKRFALQLRSLTYRQSTSIWRQQKIFIWKNSSVIHPLRVARRTTQTMGKDKLMSDNDEIRFLFLIAHYDWNKSDDRQTNDELWRIECSCERSELIKRFMSFLGENSELRNTKRLQ